MTTPNTTAASPSSVPANTFPPEVAALIANMQQQIAALTAQLPAAAAPVNPESIASQQNGAVQALAFVEALEVAIGSKSYVDSVAAAQRLVDLLNAIQR